MAAKYDIVLVDTNALSYDLAEMGLTAVKFSQCCGKADKWLSSIIYRKRVDRGTVEFIEDRMFKDRGTYTIEIPQEPEEETAKQVRTAEVNPEIGYIRTNMNSHFHEVETRLSAVEKAIREIPSTEEKLDQVLSKMNQQIILMNRMLELWGYKKGERNETCVGKS